MDANEFIAVTQNPNFFLIQVNLEYQDWKPPSLSELTP